MAKGSYTSTSVIERRTSVCFISESKKIDFEHRNIWKTLSECHNIYLKEGCWLESYCSGGDYPNI